MNGLRKHFFARPRFAGDEHRQRIARRRAGESHCLGHARRRAHDVAECVAAITTIIGTCIVTYLVARIAAFIGVAIGSCIAWGTTCAVRGRLLAHGSDACRRRCVAQGGTAAEQQTGPDHVVRIEDRETHGRDADIVIESQEHLGGLPDMPVNAQRLDMLGDRIPQRPRHLRAGPQPGGRRVGGMQDVAVAVDRDERVLRVATAELCEPGQHGHTMRHVARREHLTHR